jgi:hypothetical protein
MRKRVIGLIVVIGILALPTGSATAGPSCVGQYSSTVARQDGAAFGADISAGAQFANFGAGVVAPYAHLPRDVC